MPFTSGILNRQKFGTYGNPVVYSWNDDRPYTVLNPQWLNLWGSGQSTTGVSKWVDYISPSGSEFQLDPSLQINININLNYPRINGTGSFLSLPSSGVGFTESVLDSIAKNTVSGLLHNQYVYGNYVSTTGDDTKLQGSIYIAGLGSSSINPRFEFSSLFHHSLDAIGFTGDTPFIGFSGNYWPATPTFDETDSNVFPTEINNATYQSGWAKRHAYSLINDGGRPVLKPTTFTTLYFDNGINQLRSKLSNRIAQFYESGRKNYLTADGTRVNILRPATLLFDFESEIFPSYFSNTIYFNPAWAGTDRDFRFIFPSASPGDYLRTTIWQNHVNATEFLTGTPTNRFTDQITWEQYGTNKTLADWWNTKVKNIYWPEASGYNFPRNYNIIDIPGVGSGLYSEFERIIASSVDRALYKGIAEPFQEFVSSDILFGNYDHVQKNPERSEEYKYIYRSAYEGGLTSEIQCPVLYVNIPTGSSPTFSGQQMDIIRARIHSCDRSKPIIPYILLPRDQYFGQSYIDSNPSYGYNQDFFKQLLRVLHNELGIYTYHIWGSPGDRFGSFTNGDVNTFVTIWKEFRQEIAASSNPTFGRMIGGRLGRIFGIRTVDNSKNIIGFGGTPDIL